MMVLPSKKELKLISVFDSYIPHSVEGAIEFKGEYFKSDTPEHVFKAYSEWLEIIKNKSKTNQFD